MMARRKRRKERVSVWCNAVAVRYPSWSEWLEPKGVCVSMWLPK